MCVLRGLLFGPRRAPVTVVQVDDDTDVLSPAEAENLEQLAGDLLSFDDSTLALEDSGLNLVPGRPCRDCSSETERTAQMTQRADLVRSVPAEHFAAMVEALVDDDDIDTDQLSAFVQSTIGVVIHSGAPATPKDGGTAEAGESR